MPLSTGVGTTGFFVPIRAEIMPNWPIQVWIILIPVLLLGIVSVLLPFVAPRNKRPDDEHWHGFFYSNPNDPALLVPKRYGIGYTLNFGNRWSWPLLFLVLLMAALPVLLALTNMHALRGPRGHT